MFFSIFLSRFDYKILVLNQLTDISGSIVASSLQPQLYMLLRDSQLCGSVNSAYWTGLVETMFALGSIAGQLIPGGWNWDLEMLIQGK